MGDEKIWVPVAKESENIAPRAFLPFYGLESKYLHGYKADISEDAYLDAIVSIQKAYISNESKFFWVKNNTEQKRQIKAKWRTSRKKNASLLLPSKGWVEVPFKLLTTINAAQLADALNSVDGKFVTFQEKLEPDLILDSYELIEKADEIKKNIGTNLPKGQEVPSKGERIINVYLRDANVVAYVLNAAGDYCESCGGKAPFLKKNGEPYLEIHHVLPLSKGGTDTITNTVAICPNCHREAHYSDKKEDLVSKLYSQICRLRQE